MTQEDVVYRNYDGAQYEFMNHLRSSEIDEREKEVSKLTTQLLTE